MKKLKTSIEIAKRIADLADDKKGFDISIVNVGPSIGLADYFVIVSASSDKQAKAIYSYVDDELSKIKVKHCGVEGEVESLWILVDYGDVVLHVFQKDTRDYYQLERLWPEAEIIKHENAAS